MPIVSFVNYSYQMQELRAAASFHVRNSRDSSLGAVTTIYVVLLRCSCDFSLFSKMVFIQ